MTTGDNSGPIRIRAATARWFHRYPQLRCDHRAIEIECSRLLMRIAWNQRAVRPREFLSAQGCRGGHGAVGDGFDPVAFAAGLEEQALREIHARDAARRSFLRELS